MRSALATLLALVVGLAAACPEHDKRALALARPEGTGQGTARARIVLANGATEVRPATGGPFVASAGTDLLTSDVLTPASGAFVVIQLDNHWLVRVDDVGPLAVGDVLLLGAAAPQASVEQQLAQLLGAGAAQALPDVRSRVAGWESRLRAAETGTAESKEAASAAPVAMNEARSGDRAADDFEGAGGGSMAPASAPPAPPPPPAPKGAAPAEAKPTADGAGPSPVDSAESLETKSAPARAAQQRKKRERPAVPVAKKESTAEDVVPPAAQVPSPAPPQRLRARVVVRGGEERALPTLPTALAEKATVVERCLVEAVAAMGISPAQVTLRLEVRGGVVRRVWIDGAVPVPSCAADALVGLSVSDVPATSWLVVTVLLTR